MCLFSRSTRIGAVLFHLLLWSAFVSANTEKVIFRARASDFPAESSLPDRSSFLDQTFQLRWITPKNHTLTATIPFNRLQTDTNPHPSTSWFILGCLPEKQVFELRVCWPATQPTRFDLSLFSPPDLAQDPALVSSLSEFLNSSSVSVGPYGSETKSHDHNGKSDTVNGRRYHQPLCQENSSTDPPTCPETRQRQERQDQQLRVQRQLQHQAPATAQYYLRINAFPESVHIDPMARRAPVVVDITLDPYLFNVFPRSLVPSAGYIAAVAVVSYLVFPIVWALLSSLGTNPKTHLE